MIHIFTSVVNRPDFVSLQQELFNKFLKNEYKFHVVDDSVDARISSEFYWVCKSNGVEYYRKPPADKPMNPAQACAHTIQWTYDNLIRKNHSEDIVLFLDSDMFLIDEFDIEYLEKEPKLLGYQANDAKYGLEFMSTMMMRDAKSQCLASTDFYLNAIDLGIQEQVVKAALGAAGDATSKANQRIVGDTMTSLNNLKQKKGLS